MSIGKTPCPLCGGPMHRGNVRCGKCRDLALQKPQEQPTPAETQLTEDREKRRLRSELSQTRALYEASLKTNAVLESQLAAITHLDTSNNSFVIEPKEGSGTSEGTAVMVASDWHVEETVGAEVGDLNRHDPEISHSRSVMFFQSGLRLVRLLQKDLKINTICVPLLGDFISNDIHEEFTDIVSEQPMHALVTAQNMLLSGIEFLLNHSECNLVLPCHSGNHARTTKTTRFASENGHSLEYILYLWLASEFKNEPRVQFIIPQSYHSYVDFYGKTVRFHHGHAIKYAGGVGGIYIPVNKALAQWNKARTADLDVFGHFHQQRDGGNFLSNGSLIGYSAYALSIKADYEPPRQTLFLMDKKRGRTCTWPILVQ